MSFLRHPFVIALMGAILFGVSLSLRTEATPVATPTPVEEIKTTPTLKERSEARALTDAFKAVPLGAQAVVVWDVKQARPLFGRNSTAQMPLASLTKPMLAYSANQVIGDDVVVTVTGRDLAEEGSSGMRPGDRFLYKDLRSATLVASLNDGANAISRTMGEILKKDDLPSLQMRSAIGIMNASAFNLGLSQSFFYNEDGLDLGPGQPGALGSAEDVAKIFSALITEYPDTLKATTEGGYVLTALSGAKYQYWNTNQRLNDVPNLKGSKTGYTALADGNLAVAFEYEGTTLVVVILGSSKEGRFDDVRSVVSFLLSHPLPKLADMHDILAS
jgi:D-alanyl-D-alanine carboxypeptidase